MIAHNFYKMPIVCNKPVIFKHFKHLQPCFKCIMLIMSTILSNPSFILHSISSSTAANLWVREFGQEFRRKCSLNELE